MRIEILPFHQRFIPAPGQLNFHGAIALIIKKNMGFISLKDFLIYLFHGPNLGLFLFEHMVYQIAKPVFD